MNNKIIEFIEKEELFIGIEKVVVGVSGGADSICLLLVLLEIGVQFGVEVIPVHINHNLRGSEALRDQKFVEEVCGKFGLELQVESVDLAGYKIKHKVSEEEAGRILRRNILERFATEGSVIALGHHRDDNVETCLMNMARGSGLEGLSGIAPKDGKYVRPLLCVNRAEIEKYLVYKKQAYCIDSTNLENTYTRNKVRNHIIPMLRSEINMKASENISNLLDDLNELKGFVNEQVRDQHTKVVKARDGEIIILKQALEECHPFVRREIVKKALIDTAQQYKDIGRVHILSVIELLELQVGKEVHLPYGLVAYRTYEGVLIGEKTDRGTGSDFRRIPIRINGQTVVNEDLVIETQVTEYNGLENVLDNDYTKYYDYDIIIDKLFVDIIDMGAYICINEQGGRQSLKKFCKNQKIPMNSRKEVLNIRTDSQVLWILGYRRSLEARVTKETKKILKIQIGG